MSAVASARNLAVARALLLKISLITRFMERKSNTQRTFFRLLALEESQEGLAKKAKVERIMATAVALPLRETGKTTS